MVGEVATIVDGWFVAVGMGVLAKVFIRIAEGWCLDARLVKVLLVEPCLVTPLLVEARLVEAWWVEARLVEAWGVEARLVEAWWVEVRFVKALSVGPDGDEANNRKETAEDFSLVKKGR